MKITYIILASLAVGVGVGQKIGANNAVEKKRNHYELRQETLDRYAQHAARRAFEDQKKTGQNMAKGRDAIQRFAPQEAPVDTTGWPKTDQPFNEWLNR